MAREIALVDDVLDVAVGRTRGKTKASAIDVKFGAGAVGRLDFTSARGRAWAEVLKSLQEHRQPAYVEIDPETRYIKTLLLPLSFSVKTIREALGTGDLEIELEISHAVHYLRRDSPRFEELRKVLERARRQKEKVLVTESLDSEAIVDVRPVPSTSAARHRKTPSRSR